MTGDATPTRVTGGVLGGLGPLATAQFLMAVLDNTEVMVEQDHVDLIVSQRSSTPDRTAAIMGTGPSPAPRMAADAAMLEAAGAAFIVIPCNTASNFLDSVEEAVDIPVVAIVDETVQAVKARVPGARRMALMATDGTIRSCVYQQAAADRGLEVILPSEDLQRRIMAMIYEGVKVGLPVPEAELLACVEELRAIGADAVVAGCTEISVLCAQYSPMPPYVVDSLEVLARRTVELAGARLRPRR